MNNAHFASPEETQLTQWAAETCITYGVLDQQDPPSSAAVKIIAIPTFAYSPKQQRKLTSNNNKNDLLPYNS
jgi:hypothetical protein